MIRLLMWLSLFALPALAQEFKVDEEMTVKRHVFDVRVIDAMGRPVSNLGVNDFKLTHKGKDIPILSCDWITGLPDSDPDVARANRELGLPEQKYPGRLLIFFFQVELNAPRVSGMQDKLNNVAEVLATDMSGGPDAPAGFTQAVELGAHAVELGIEKVV